MLREIGIYHHKICHFGNKDYVELKSFEKTRDTEGALSPSLFCLKSGHKFPFVKVCSSTRMRWDEPA